MLGLAPLVLVRACAEDREARFVLGLWPELAEEPGVRRFDFPGERVRVEDVERRKDSGELGVSLSEYPESLRSILIDSSLGEGTGLLMERGARMEG
jgi:hypothetical protein